MLTTASVVAGRFCACTGQHRWDRALSSAWGRLSGLVGAWTAGVVVPVVLVVAVVGMWWCHGESVSTLTYANANMSDDNVGSGQRRCRGSSGGARHPRWPTPHPATGPHLAGWACGGIRSKENTQAGTHVGGQLNRVQDHRKTTKLESHATT